MLRDPRVVTATREVADDKRKSRSQLQREIRAKNDAVKALSREYASRSLSRDDIELCLCSISDNNSFLGQAREPVQRMIDLLKHYFSPDKAEEGMSLAIASDQEGARLTHTHERQVREREWAQHVGCCTRWCVCMCTVRIGP